MSAAENPKYIEALLQKLQSGEPLSPDPHWDGHLDSLTLVLLHLFVTNQITPEQAALVLGKDVSLALWTRFGDLKVTGPDPREKIYSA
jgi:hypothetical protein